jgi:uncharacterized protein DUF4105
MANISRFRSSRASQKANNTRRCAASSASTNYIYVVADDRDLVGLRTNYRGEQVNLYRVRIPVSQARALLVDYLTEANGLSDRSQWYNAFTQNCTTTTPAMRKTLAPAGAWAGGYSPMVTSINSFTNVDRSIQTSLLTTSEVAATSQKGLRPRSILAIFHSHPDRLPEAHARLSP